ncbi:SHOCT domain-containing protein [Agaribacterium sp. ZY112]|uniref:SHOCT domain-containing protein n=1 Tax=Agaribacterium sp. ZY112 TaxID=3233574 RepID=UPI003525CCCA
MKSSISLKSILVLFGFSASVWVLADDSALIVESVDKKACSLVLEQACITKKHDAEKKCLPWHKKEASSKGANTVLIGETTVTTHRRPMYDGTSKKVKETTISASYYLCPVEAASVDSSQSVNQQVKPAQDLSIEQRLTQLNELHEKGLISDSEYKDKRASILNEL